MRKYSIIILQFLLGLLSASAAEPGTPLSGKVSDDTTAFPLHGKVSDDTTREPLAGVIVKAKGGFTTTDREGHFSLTASVGADSVSFRCMDYEALVLPVSADFADIRLSRKATELKDVIVEAPDIYARGDTLVFNVARYANAKDNAIIDVIKRLPGIKVKDDGTIEYQGKPISKFYLDGNDFIGGQYGLATNNISHKDVKAVEVMENHQPVKAFEGIEFPEEAGINLKLKEDARSRWVGVAQAAAGIQPFLYDGSLFTMRMARRVQSMFTLKADNTGWNPANEIQDHDFDLSFSSDLSSSLWPEYIGADIISSPLAEKRTRDNLSWLADAITAWRKGDTSMRLKLDYTGDCLDYSSGLRTDYFSPEIPTFIQHNSLHTRNQSVSAQFYSETNRQGFYLKDKLNLSGEWAGANSGITGSFDLSQHVSRKNLSARNDLKLVKRNDKRLFTLTSRNAFSYRPDCLTVTGEEDAVQSIGVSDFRSTTETRFGKLTRFWKFYLTAGIDLNFHRMNNSLSGLGVFDNEGTYNAFLSNLYAVPQMDYIRKGWKISLQVPAKWLLYSLRGTENYINASPRLSVRKQLTAKSELSASASYRLASPPAYMRIDVPVLSDYRNLFIAGNSGKNSQETSASVSYSYRNPMKALFLNISASYAYRRSTMMSNQLFIGDYIVSSYTDRLSHANTWQVKGGASKGLGHSRMVVGIEATASSASASSMRDNAVIPYTQGGISLSPYFKGSIVKWLSANYEAKYSFSTLNINNERNLYHTLHQNLFLTLIPHDLLDLTLGAEHFLTRFPEGNRANLILLDASAAWRVSAKIRLSLTANNLLNKRRYEYATYGVLSRSEHSFQLRSRSIIASLQYRF